MIEELYMTHPVEHLIDFNRGLVLGLVMETTPMPRLHWLMERLLPLPFTDNVITARYNQIMAKRATMFQEALSYRGSDTRARLAYLWGIFTRFHAFIGPNHLRFFEVAASHANLVALDVLWNLVPDKHSYNWETQLVKTILLPAASRGHLGVLQWIHATTVYKAAAWATQDVYHAVLVRCADTLAGVAILDWLWDHGNRIAPIQHVLSYNRAPAVLDWVARHWVAAGEDASELEGALADPSSLVSADEWQNAYG
jgi:hypothetical protein